MKLFYVLLASLLSLATPAFALEHEIPFVYGSMGGSCSGCTPVTITALGAAPVDVLNVPYAAGETRSKYFAGRFPENASTGNVGFSITTFGTTDTPTGTNVCDRACMGVVLEGQDLDDIDMTACVPLTPQSVQSAEDVMKENTFAFNTIAPKDTTSTPCATTACDGAVYIVLWQRDMTGSCATINEDARNYFMLTVRFNQ